MIRNLIRCTFTAAAMASPDRIALGDTVASLRRRLTRDMTRHKFAKIQEWGKHFTIFGTPGECAGMLKGYAEAGLTTIIARIASDDVRGQAQLLLNDIKPKLVS